MEGQESGVSNAVEQGQLWGFFPPPAGNLIVDPGFELNRSSWTVPAGARIEESASARSGDYRLFMSSTEGYDDGFLVANSSALTPVVPGQLIGVGGFVLGAVSTTGTAFSYINFYTADLALDSTVQGTGVSLSTSWQTALVKAIVPANVVWAQYVFQIVSLSGEAAWDDMIALAVRKQVELGENTDQEDFSSTTETILTECTFGPTAQVPVSGVASLTSPVIILANCVYNAGVGAGGDVTFRIRRTDEAGSQLSIAQNLVAANGTLCLMAFDTAPNVTAQTWVLTGQMADGTGGATAQHRIKAEQHYL
jgi:hypothetical protein